MLNVNNPKQQLIWIETGDLYVLKTYECISWSPPCNPTDKKKGHCKYDTDWSQSAVNGPSLEVDHTNWSICMLYFLSFSKKFGPSIACFDQVVLPQSKYDSYTYSGCISRHEDGPLHLSPTIKLKEFGLLSQSSNVKAFSFSSFLFSFWRVW